jgi:hypothetical protein
VLLLVLKTKPNKEQPMGATRGQHYLPQFLLKGFASRTKENKVWVHYFRRGGAGKEVSVKDIGKETDFHGNPRDSDLEAKMGAIESAFSPYVIRWREGKFLSGVDEEVASQFVAHFIVRTKSVREAFAGGVQVLMEEVLGRLDRGELDPFRKQGIEDQMIREISKDPRLAKVAKQKPREFRELIKAELGRLNRSGLPLQWSQEAAQYMREAINVQKSTAQAHVKSLTENQIPAIRVQILQRLVWSVVCTNPGEMILGDVGAVAREIDDTQLKHPMVFEFNKIGMLCCPIGSSSVLVAHARGINHAFSSDEINRASAELSREFFVSSGPNQRFDDLLNIIGKRADMMSPEEIRGLIPKEMPSFRKKTSPDLDSGS